MDRLTTHDALYKFVLNLVPSLARTKDDAIIIDAFQSNDIRHVCQAIRNAQTNEVKYQHLTLRFGGNSEQSVYSYDLSRQMTFCLDMYSLYLAIKHISFQLEAFHPDMISNLVVPIQAETLNWPLGQAFLQQIFYNHRDAMSHITPCVQLHASNLDQMSLSSNIASLKNKTTSLWVDIHTPSEYLEFLEQCKPDAIKVSQLLETKEMRDGLIPIVRFVRKKNIKFIAGRVATQKDLNQFKLLGASYYFGYISDIPASMTTREIRLISNS